MTPEPKIVYRIICRKTGETMAETELTSRHEIVEHDTITVARSRHCTGMYKDRNEFAVAKYKVTYELLDEDCDPPTEEDFKQAEINRKVEEWLDREGYTDPCSRAYFGMHFRTYLMLADACAKVDIRDILKTTQQQ